jgi:hypothetical protein
MMMRFVAKAMHVHPVGIPVEFVPEILFYEWLSEQIWLNFSLE